MAVLEAFVYDPLIAWRLNATNQPGGKVNEGDVIDDQYGKQRKSKANETEILNGELTSAPFAPICNLLPLLIHHIRLSCMTNG